MQKKPCILRNIYTADLHRGMHLTGLLCPREHAGLTAVVRLLLSFATDRGLGLALTTVLIWSLMCQGADPWSPMATSDCDSKATLPLLWLSSHYWLSSADRHTSHNTLHTPLSFGICDPICSASEPDRVVPALIAGCMDSSPIAAVLKTAQVTWGIRTPPNLVSYRRVEDKVTPLYLRHTRYLLYRMPSFSKVTFTQNPPLCRIFTMKTHRFLTPVPILIRSLYRW